MIHFKNQPKPSENISDIDRRFNLRRISLVPQIENLLGTLDIFKDREITVEFSHKGVSSLVCFMECDDKRYVLKIPLSVTVRFGEAWFLKEWESAGVSVPHVFEEGSLGEHTYLLMEYVDAPSLTQML